MSTTAFGGLASISIPPIVVCLLFWFTLGEGQYPPLCSITNVREDYASAPYSSYDLVYENTVYPSAAAFHTGTNYYTVYGVTIVVSGGEGQTFSSIGLHNSSDNIIEDSAPADLIGNFDIPEGTELPTSFRQMTFKASTPFQLTENTDFWIVVTVNSNLDGGLWAAGEEVITTDGTTIYLANADYVSQIQVWDVYTRLGLMFTVYFCESAIPSPSASPSKSHSASPSKSKSRSRSPSKKKKKKN